MSDPELAKSELAKLAAEMGYETLARALGWEPPVPPAASVPAPTRDPPLAGIRVRPPMHGTRIKDMDDGERAWLARMMLEHALAGTTPPRLNIPVSEMTSDERMDLSKRMLERARSGLR